MKPRSELVISPRLHQKLGEMTIDVYLDIDDERVASAVFAAVDELARIVGVDDIASGELQRGSFFRRSKATLQIALSDKSVQERLQLLERLFELWQVDPRQADIDQKTSNALSQVINSLHDVPRACIRFGSLLVIKYNDNSGGVLLARQLSQPEILALEKYPELQKILRL
jgi:hypothetical protein